MTEQDIKLQLLAICGGNLEQAQAAHDWIATADNTTADVAASAMRALADCLERCRADSLSQTAERLRKEAWCRDGIA